jgi:imidazole glycerol phosphate synthase subunit HisF
MATKKPDNGRYVPNVVRDFFHKYNAFCNDEVVLLDTTSQRNKRSVYNIAINDIRYTLMAYCFFSKNEG